MCHLPKNKIPQGLLNKVKVRDPDKINLIKQAVSNWQQDI